MKLLRQTIRQLIMESFTEQDVRAQMAQDSRNYGSGQYGANAKDIFRQQREADPEIDEFLKSVITIHWVPVNWTDEFSTELDHEVLREPLQNTNQNDELSCSPYRPFDDGTPMNIWSGWHKQDKIGIQIDGWISWLEHGDASSGHGRGNTEDSPSGHNKQPRKTKMGWDRRKGNSMADVIQSDADFLKRKSKQLSTFGDGEALVDNWEPVKVWYFEGYEMAAMQAAVMLSKRFNKRIPYQTPQGPEQFGVEDINEDLGDNPEDWTP